MSCGNHMSEFYRGGDKHKRNYFSLLLERCSVQPTLPTECVDIYVAAWNDPRTYGKNQLLVEEDSFGRACLDIKGTNKVGYFKGLASTGQQLWKMTSYFQKVCVCYIQKSTNPGYLPCNTVGKRLPQTLLIECDTFFFRPKGLFDQCPPNSGWWCQNGYGYGSRSYGRGYGDARAMNRYLAKDKFIVL